MKRHLFGTAKRRRIDRFAQSSECPHPGSFEAIANI
jgi:hypothetical protein